MHDINAHFDATGAQVSRFILRLGRFLDKNILKIVEQIKRGELTGIEAARMLGSLKAELQTLGLEKEFARIAEPYKSEIKWVRSQFERIKLPNAFANTDKTVIEALINVRLDAAREALELHVADVRQLLTDAAFGVGKDNLDEYYEKARDSFDSTFETELNTTLSGFSREITAKVAEDLGLTMFEYIGPEDDITRPFCQDLLDRNPPIYSRDEIEAMDNEQGLPVMTYGGGWNCRHQWRPVEGGEV